MNCILALAPESQICYDVSLNFGYISGIRLQILHGREKSKPGSESSAITCICVRMVLKDLLASGS